MVAAERDRDCTVRGSREEVGAASLGEVTFKLGLTVRKKLPCEELEKRGRRDKGLQPG